MIGKLLNWEPGRLNTGYSKKLLLTGKFPLPFDIYILRYTKGQFIPPHVDKVDDGYSHYRANLVLIKGEGGVFICDICIFKTPRFVLFRPDQNLHCVSEVTNKSRYILSIGWLIKNK